MNTNLIALLKTSTKLMNAQGMSLYKIVEDLEMTYDALGGEAMGKKLLTSAAIAWINEPDQPASQCADKATGAW